MSSPKVASQMLQGFLDAFNAHDVDTVMSFFSEDCVFDMPRGPAPGGRRLVGKDEVREGIRSRFEGIPDVRYGDDRHWVCGDRGVSEWTFTGTRVDGTRVEVHGCDFYTFCAGEVIRKDSYWKLVETN